MNVKTMYLCPACQTEHESHLTAEYCCEVKEIYTCGECGKRYDDYDLANAKSCCEEKVRLARVEALSRLCLCGETLTDEDVHDAGVIGSLPRCRACILKVAPEMVAA